MGSLLEEDLQQNSVTCCSHVKVRNKSQFYDHLFTGRFIYIYIYRCGCVIFIFIFSFILIISIQLSIIKCACVYFLQC